MQAAQLQEYELALEENAFPFEEKAIGVHEKNLELIRSGIYNDWIEKSLAKLAQLMPARYAKVGSQQRLLGFDRSLRLSRAVSTCARRCRRSGERDRRTGHRIDSRAKRRFANEHSGRRRRSCQCARTLMRDS